MIVRRLKDDELYHHGIEGQKWGVRHGPPYPLDAKGHSLRKQKRLMKKQEEALRDSDTTRILALKANKKLKKRNSRFAVDDHYLDNVVAKRYIAKSQYYDLKMRKAGGDKTVNDDLKETKRYLKKVKDYDKRQFGNVVIHNPVDGALTEARRNQHAAQKAMKKTEKIINKYGDKKLIGDKRAEKKIKKTIEKTNRILSKIDGYKISSYNKSIGKKNAKVEYSKPKTYKEMLQRTNYDFGVGSNYVLPKQKDYYKEAEKRRRFGISDAQVYKKKPKYSIS